MYIKQREIIMYFGKNISIDYKTVHLLNTYLKKNLKEYISKSKIVTYFVYINDNELKLLQTIKLRKVNI